ncbi:MAG: nucleotide excision repair endonuclease [Verrucomicrobia bacterium]|nr:nucleotide excision repair endonuclease [Verrucomicrobiota bacterium]MBI3867753.1 nucleotide excision repair endonuclease [Verrucomicrobiota bacterium]
MNPFQQRLFPDEQPIVDRLGREFFLRLPDVPGVYFMQDASGQVLYVGKAKSLKRRLCCYRVANPDRMARRTLRLLRLVAQIEWEACVDEAAAIQRESELLLSIKPRFNRAGVWRGPRRSLVWRCEDAGFRLRIVDSAEEGWGCIGPYGAFVRRLHRVLARRVWCHLHPHRGIAGMPAGWTHGLHGPDVTIPAQTSTDLAAVRDLVDRSFQGHADALSQWACSADSAFERAGWQEDIEFLVDRYHIEETPGGASKGLLRE